MLGILVENLTAILSKASPVSSLQRASLSQSESSGSDSESDEGVFSAELLWDHFTAVVHKHVIDDGRVTDVIPTQTQDTIEEPDEDWFPSQPMQTDNGMWHAQSCSYGIASDLIQHCNTFHKSPGSIQ